MNGCFSSTDRRKTMAPKKKPQKQTSNKPVVAPSIPNSSHKKPSKAPKLQISAEDENHLRRLLLKFGRTASPVHNSLSNTQKRTKLTNIFEKLSNEGFSVDQIEFALSSLRDGATFDGALDWLCLNLPSHELPANFSAGASRFPTTGGYVGVISTSRKDWTEPVESSVQQKQEEPEVLIPVKGKRGGEDTDTLSSCQPSQADWIRQYMKRLEEEELESSDDEESVPWPFDVIAEEYFSDESDDVKAKRKGDKRRQKQEDVAICKLEQELSALGLSETMLESEFQREQAFEGATEKEVTSSMPDDVLVSVNADLTLYANPVGSCISEEIQPNALPLISSAQELALLDDILDDMELGDLFLEPAPEPFPHEILELQKKKKMKELCDEKNIWKLEGFWKKGEAKKIPKAFLHKLCHKSGWEAPKFNKVAGEGSNISYTISVKRKSSGCGKTRQAGGLVNLQLPHEVEDSESIEDAQNRIAAYALHKLFPELPVYFAIKEPYASLVLIWRQEESFGIQSREEERRENFVESLLEADNFRLTNSSSGVHDALPLVDSCVKENDDLDVFKSSHEAKRDSSLEAECSSLKKRHENKKKMPKYKDMLKCRAALPISEVKNDILQHLKEKDVLVVCGETGSGKTTQVPQYILDDMIDSGNDGYCNIICTQPRRMAAVSVAQRVADERCESSPGVGDSLAGYQIRQQNAWSDNTRLLFCTTGILLRKLVGDKTLKDVTHIIVDEVHERTLMEKLNEDIIDYELLEELICHIDATCEEGAILVFLPGMAEINMLCNRLAASKRFGGRSANWLLPLHSSIGPTEQRKVFLRPPRGIRKVIIATNIAETSITIDDVVYVIDSGKHKENRYNPEKKLSSMVENWVSKANARQRRGRAGRVKPGHCFSLYTRHRFEKLMRPYQVPEMLRTPLVELCLQIKLLGLGYIRPFLSKALEPPSESAINSAISLLDKVGAVEGDEELTPLGHHLAKLPVDVLIGKMLLFGGIFGCLSPILSIAAFLSHKSPFIHHKDEKQNVDGVKLALLSDKMESSSNINNNDRQSDHLLMMIAYEKWVKILNEQGNKAAESFCDSKFLSSSVMRLIRDRRMEFGSLLADIRLINLPKTEECAGRKKENLDVWFSDRTQPFNMYSHEPQVVKAILCAGLCPNIAEGLVNRSTKPEKQTQKYAVWHDGRREVHIHQSSINKNCKAFQYPFLVFLDKVESKKVVYLRDTTVVSPFSILLFGGSVNVHHQSGSVTIDGWLKLAAPAQTAVLFKELRLTLHSILNDLIQKPEKSGIVHNEVVKSVVHLLVEEGKHT